MFYRLSPGTSIGQACTDHLILCKFAQNIGLCLYEKEDTMNSLWDTSCFCVAFTGRKWKETLLCLFSS